MRAQIKGMSRKGKEFFKFNTQVGMQWGCVGGWGGGGGQGCWRPSPAMQWRLAAPVARGGGRWARRGPRAPPGPPPPPPPPVPRQVTESITRVDVHEKNIWSAAEYVHNHFIGGRR